MPEATTERGDNEILVIGGGISGLTAALEAAEAGCRVTLIEKAPYLGGRVIGFHRYFPKLCPPACGIEINLQRIKKNPRIRVFTLAELERLEGSPGNYSATVKLSPRFITDDCTGCNACSEVCPAERADDFNAGMSRTKAAYLPFKMAFPPRYVIDRPACEVGCDACLGACPYGAVDLNQQTERRTFRVAAVIAATGWRPYDAARIDGLRFGKHPNIVTNVILERLAAPDGPTGGRILKPSDGNVPKRVVFVQCAGSRDQNHLPYCSGVCCAASIKQATYVREQNPEAEVTIFYIDLRLPGHLQEFCSKVMADGRIRLIRGKVGRIDPGAGDGELLAIAEDTEAGRKLSVPADLVVLATGMVPQTSGLPDGFILDEFGFVGGGGDDLYAAGCITRPQEVASSVREGTGAALQALQSVVRGAHHG